MKSFLATLSLLFLFSFTFSTTQKKIVGRWEITKLEKEGGKSVEKRSKFIVFNEDGSLEAGRIGSEPNKSGSWKYNKAENTITLKSVDGTNSDDGDYLIDKITDSELILIKSKMHIYMEKVKK